jgi:hypothetical protein
MDPLPAVGLAGSVVHFVSFAHEIVSMGKEVYNSPTGARQESVELGTMLEDLAKLHESLRYQCNSNSTLFAAMFSTRRSREKSTLSNLVDNYEPIYKELQKVLQSLAIQRQSSKMEELLCGCKACLEGRWDSLFGEEIAQNPVSH